MDMICGFAANAKQGMSSFSARVRRHMMCGFTANTKQGIVFGSPQCRKRLERRPRALLVTELRSTDGFPGRRFPMSDLRQRYQKYVCAVPAVDLTLDISRMRFDDGFLDRLAPALDRAYNDMEALEKGAIANPDEG